MKRTIFWALVALNVVLLAALLMPYVAGNHAMAQRAGGGGNKRTELVMIPGEVNGGNSAVVYLIDTNNRQLGAVTIDNRGTGLVGVAPENLDRIFDGGGARPGNKRGK
jgi:hypothetical protein